MGDENVHLVRAVLDEVFGSQNFCQQIAYTTTSGLSSELIPSRISYLLWYAKNRAKVKFRQLYTTKTREAGTAETYSWLKLRDGTMRGMTKAEKDGEVAIPDGAKIYKPDNITSQGNPEYTFTYRGKSVAAPYKASPSGMEKLALAGRIHVAKNSFQYVRFLEDFAALPIGNLWTDTQTGSFTGDKIYVVQTSTKVVERCILMTSDPGDLVLDPTCGSGTSAYCAEKWGRRWITIDTSRVALAISRQRLMTAEFPYYLLADSEEGRKKEQELSGKPFPDNMPTPEKKIAKGFVNERVQHIKMSHISKNPDIVPGMSQEEMDAAIKRVAEFEYLFDLPSAADGIVRVTGPFTVESLSPGSAESLDDSTSDVSDDRADFIEVILDNMLTAGIQNREKGGRTTFTDIERIPGEYVNAIGLTGVFGLVVARPLPTLMGLKSNGTP
jgi:adenine-specific DNA-methyltransferase